MKVQVAAQIKVIINEIVKSPSERSPVADKFLFNIDSDDLKELKKYFFPSIPDTDINEFDYHEDKNLGKSLTQEEFVDAIEKIFGKPHLNVPASLFFKTLQEKCKIKDKIHWNEFLDSIVDQFKVAQKTFEETATTDILQVSNTFEIGNEKSPVLQMIALVYDNAICFAVINLMLNVQMYTQGMVLFHSYNIEPLSGLMKRAIWISSACASSDGKTIFISTSDRYMYIYDSSRQIHILKFIISGCSNVFSCQQYVSFKNDDEKTMLVLGDDSGSITFMTFHKKSKSLFMESQEKGVGRYTWMEIKKQKAWVTIMADVGVHHSYVMEVAYISSSDTVISCSPDPLTSVVIKKRRGHSPIFLLKLKKSLRCFAVDEALGYFATSTNTFAYLWRTSTPHSPIIKLPGHEKKLIDLCFLSQTFSLLTLSEDGMLKVWNLEHFKCVQTINLNCCFTQGKIYFFAHKIYKTYQSKTYPNNSANESLVLKNLYIINGSLVIKLRLSGVEETDEEIQLPTKIFEPSIPSSEVIFKNYDRERPFSISTSQPDDRLRLRTGEDFIMHRKFFISNGAPYLALRTIEINEDIINSVKETLQEKMSF